MIIVEIPTKIENNKVANDYFRKVNVKIKKKQKNNNQFVEWKRKIITITTKEKLLLRGFNFNYLTNTYKIKQDRMYYFVYEFFGYLSLLKYQYASFGKK